MNIFRVILTEISYSLVRQVEAHCCLWHLNYL